jgi:hypothetical protein
MGKGSGKTHGPGEGAEMEVDTNGDVVDKIDEVGVTLENDQRTRSALQAAARAATAKTKEERMLYKSISMQQFGMNRLEYYNILECCGVASRVCKSVVTCKYLKSP